MGNSNGKTLAGQREVCCRPQILPVIPIPEFTNLLQQFFKPVRRSLSTDKTNCSADQHGCQNHITIKENWFQQLAGHNTHSESKSCSQNHRDDDVRGVVRPPVTFLSHCCLTIEIEELSDACVPSSNASSPCEISVSLLFPAKTNTRKTVQREFAAPAVGICSGSLPTSIGVSWTLLVKHGVG